MTNPAPVAVLIPSHSRPDKLRRCLDAIRHQTRVPEQVMVVLDGGEVATARLLEADYPSLPLEVRAVPHAGYVPARRQMLDACTTPLALSLNDDVVPGPTLVEAHAAAHERAAPRPVIVTGPAPFAPVAPDDDPPQSLFDRLVRASDLIFFAPTRESTPAGTPLTYRDCAGLNFSVPTDLAREAGGFHDLPHTYGYDDIELAHRLGTHAGAAVVFEPDAALIHVHRYDPAGVAVREYALGRAAWAYAGVNPAFATALFRRDVREPAEIEYAELTLRHERADAQRVERSFRTLASMPPDAIGGDRMLATLAEHWIPLKRYLWRWGLRDAARSIEPRWSWLSEAPALP